MAEFLSQLGTIPAVSLNALFPNNSNHSRLRCVFAIPSEGLSTEDCPVFAIYGSSTAITTANYNDFAIGSLIFDPYGATPSVYMKTGATTWKSQAINT